jgi:hypothetical protein
MPRATFLSRLLSPLRALVPGRYPARLSPECQVRVGFDDRDICCSYPEGTFRKVAWSELTEVRIRTTSEGPYLPDVFWLLRASEEEPRIIYPQGAVGEAALLEALQRRLPGWNDQEVIRAMRCTDDAVFQVWSASR